MFRSGANHLSRLSLARAVVAGLFALLLLEEVELGAAHAAGASDFVIIVHPDNPRSAVERKFLARAFLKEVSRWPHDEQIHPVDLGRDSGTRAKFSDAVMGRSVAAVRNYWQQRIFSGRGLPPPEVSHDEQVVRFVLEHRGGVGYVSSHADLGRSKRVVLGD